MRYARSFRPERLEVLLLIAALATLALWLLGLVAQARHWTRYFQANTEQRRTVLSTVFLRQQLWKNRHFTATYSDLALAFGPLTTLLAQRARLA